MSFVLIVMLISMLLMLFLSVPIYISVGTASLLALLCEGNLPLTLVPQRLYVSVDSFTLIAVPFFILAGDLMIKGGISKRLVNLAKSLLGWSKASMAYVTVVASALFGAISGSAVATTGAIGGFMYPEMLKDNYKPSFAAGLGAMAGTLGILIPPSIAFIVFGTQTGTSVGQLFAWGAVAGIFVAILYMIASRIELGVSKTQSRVEKFSLRQVWYTFKDAVWGLLCPVIILGGIYSGVFSPSEAAVVAILYAALVGLFIYRELNFKTLMDCLFKAAISSGTILILIGMSNIFGWVMTVENVSALISGLLENAGVNAVTFLLFINIIYLILGMIMETIPIISLTSPLFFPAAMSLGIDPIHFGVITVCNLAFGLCTPPYGVDLFMANSYSKQPVLQMVVSCRFLYLFGIIGLLAITYVPYFIMV